MDYELRAFVLFCPLLTIIFIKVPTAKSMAFKRLAGWYGICWCG